MGAAGTSDLSECSMSAGGKQLPTASRLIFAAAETPNVRAAPACRTKDRSCVLSEAVAPRSSAGKSVTQISPIQREQIADCVRILDCDSCADFASGVTSQVGFAAAARSSMRLANAIFGRKPVQRRAGRAGARLPADICACPRFARAISQISASWPRAAGDPSLSSSSPPGLQLLVVRDADADRGNARGRRNGGHAVHQRRSARSSHDARAA